VHIFIELTTTAGIANLGIYLRLKETINAYKIFPCENLLEDSHLLTPRKNMENNIRKDLPPLVLLKRIRLN
jgi:hypothetical protein